VEAGVIIVEQGPVVDKMFFAIIFSLFLFPSVCNRELKKLVEDDNEDHGDNLSRTRSH
jgi:hypothetical protein